ncbi:unnamed protein product, partial [Mesorhabditis belari]|uniref:Uncharacterized protein n=1 Tax=Mesorhabditis belari TaxID=2138241 RepID=A0AAF3FIB4_9BILA
MTSNVGDSESDEELCANHSTYSYYTPQGVIMGWDGLPVYTHVNDYIDAWIAASMILVYLRFRSIHVRKSRPLRSATSRFSCALSRGHLVVSNRLNHIPQNVVPTFDSPSCLIVIAFNLPSKGARLGVVTSSGSTH